jgi:uncharacterized protein (TIGR01777 family)
VEFLAHKLTLSGAEGKSMRVFVTGGTGLVGSHLIRRLQERGDTVVLLTRRAAAARDRFGESCTIVEGDPARAGPWMDAVADCEAVVHLAGENIFARRWNADFKQILRDSRIASTERVVEALARAPRTTTGAAKVLVSTSAIGYYGPRHDEELDEESPPGDDFLARLCVEWERAARQAETSGTRVALIRVGVVLDRHGGALPQMLTPFKMFAGGPVGSGKQWMSWVHNDDLAGIYLLALDRADARGPINGTAPNPVSNREFARVLGGVLHRPSFMKTPTWPLRLMLGEVADVIATGQRVLPGRALALGYSFKFPALLAALAHLLS